MLLPRCAWRLDADFTADDGLRVVQVTAPGSPCSVIFGSKVTSTAPGSAEGLHLVVDDIEAARTELENRGVDVSELFHDVGGVFHHGGNEGRLPGPEPQRTSYRSSTPFSDLGRNRWLLQEMTTRVPGS
ncbi:hypothetical protein GGC64_006298 [Mycobacterium sp. OAS707]|uniref:glyoxalase n=1 Tax=Mycobacterium sp. OAS707 TaxID=2663822 RepID=UPI00178A6B40|nr:glyoxalase [Mycobacterium sp. OAS707]MBE1552211.1 hypothetical protein [Mycobacterium sp. OAS707]